MPKLAKKWWYVIGAGVILLIIVISRGASGGNKTVYEFATVGTSTVIEQVSVTGTVVPADKVDLSFEKSGKVAQVLVDVGQTVTSGQLMVTLSNSDTIAALREAQANVESARAQAAQFSALVASQSAKLDELKRGTRPEELASAELAVTNAKQAEQDAATALAQAQSKAALDLANVSDAVKDVLADAYVKADDAVSHSVSDLFINVVSANPQLSFSTDLGAKSVAENGHTIAVSVVRDIGTQLRNLPTDVTGRLQALSATITKLGTIQGFLNDLSAAVNGASSLDSATVGAYKGDVVTARTTVNTALDAVRTQIQTIQSQQLAGDQAITVAQTALNSAHQKTATAQSDLVLKQAGSTPEAIAAGVAALEQAQANLQSEQAQIKQAEAAVESAGAQVEKTLLRAPFSGVVTAKNAKVGEIMGANAPAVSLISAAALQIDAYVPEIDIVKIHVGDGAQVTLDPYGSNTFFPVTVIHIDPAETVIEGVSTYKVTFAFTDHDDRVKPGMTANIDIQTNKHENVPTVPGRAVTNNAGVYTVQVKKADGTVETRTITIGLRGVDGAVEVTSGLTVGDQVVTTETKK